MRLLLIYSLISFPQYITLHPFLHLENLTFLPLLTNFIKSSLLHIAFLLKRYLMVFGLLLNLGLLLPMETLVTFWQTSNFIAYPTFIMYNKSLEEKIFPSIWKISSITYFHIPPPLLQDIFT